MENDYDRPAEDTSALVFQSHKSKIENIITYILPRLSAASCITVYCSIIYIVLDLFKTIRVD